MTDSWMCFVEDEDLDLILDSLYQRYLYLRMKEDLRAEKYKDLLLRFQAGIPTQDVSTFAPYFELEK